MHRTDVLTSNIFTIQQFSPYYHHTNQQYRFIHRRMMSLHQVRAAGEEQNKQGNKERKRPERRGGKAPYLSLSSSYPNPLFQLTPTHTNQPGGSEEAPMQSSRLVTPPPAVASARPAVEDPELKKGQFTAMWTGAVSVVFGVAYLVLVGVMNSRGDHLLPPPPEAMGM